MKRLFFVRHGETDMNIAGILSGQTETDLTEKGRKQAKDAGLYVKNKFPKIDLILCSPYRRAYDTATIIANDLGYPIDRIKTDPIFVERHFGVLEGTYASDFMSNHEYKDLDDVDNVETISQLQERANQALDYIRSLKENNILVVGHGSFGRALRRAVRNLPHSHEYEERQPIGNAETVELT